MDLEDNKQEASHLDSEEDQTGLSKAKKRESSVDRAQSSAFGARLFYFLTYALYYASLLIYKNPLRDILFLQVDITVGRVLYLVFYIATHALAIHYFLTAGNKPGFVGADQATESELQDLRLMQAEASQTEDEENIGFPVKRNEVSSKGKSKVGSAPLYDGLANSLDEGESKLERNDGFNFKETDSKVESIEHREEIEMPKRRFCEECQLIQPYRSRHCWDCNRCVRKFDHHCFWIGACVGELNHGKFWLFLFFQTLSEIVAFRLASDAHGQAVIDYPDETNDVDRRKRQHVQTVFAIFMILLFLFLIFTSILGAYHTYLIVSGQTTWEHASRSNITYMKVYPVGVMPFYTSFTENLKQVFCHGGKVQEWQLHQPYELKEQQGFNICDNEYYTCC